MRSAFCISAFCMMGIAIVALPLMEAVPLIDKGARAAETATGAYLLSSRGPDAGITPPAGVYSQDDTYSGKIGDGTTLPTGGLSDFFLNSF